MNGKDILNSCYLKMFHEGLCLTIYETRLTYFSNDDISRLYFRGRQSCNFNTPILLNPTNKFKVSFSILLRPSSMVLRGLWVIMVSGDHLMSFIRLPVFAIKILCLQA